MFSILGQNLFGGKFNYCSIDKYKYETERECWIAGGEWKLYDHNFDNVLYGMLTLFCVSSLEDWPTIMY